MYVTLLICLYCIYRNNLIGIRHHSDQHVQQYNDIDHGVRAEHEQRPKSREALNAR